MCLVSASSLSCHLLDETSLSALGELACHRHSVLKWMLSVISHTSYFMTGSAFFLLCLLECPLFFSTFFFFGALWMTESLTVVWLQQD